ncbi:MAG: hypothetical protein ACI8UO_002461 [Verrucomicrobiales bacterium]|jgi:hypothetical protein
MRIECPNHDELGSVALVSPDYDPARHSEFVENSVVVRWVYLGEIVEQFCLSREWARESGIEAGDYPLPDDYPNWEAKIRFECNPCFEKRGMPPDWLSVDD